MSSDLERLEIPNLGSCTHNMWYFAATSDIELQYTHISGVDNKVADALSRWQGTADQWQLLGLHVVSLYPSRECPQIWKD